MISKVHKDGLKALLAIFLLTILNIAFPVISFLIYIIWPIPVIYMIVKHGSRAAILLIILAALINGIAFGTSMGLYTVIGFGLVGFIVGGSLVERFSPLKVLLLTIGAVLLSNLSISLTSNYLFGFDYNQLFSEIINNIKQVPELVDMSAVIQQQFEFVQLILPAILVISSVVSGILTYYAAHWYLKRKGLKLKIFPQVRFWRFPRWWISLGIIASLLLKSNIYLLNLNIILFFLVFLQGFAVGLFYLKKLSPFLTMAYIFLIIVFNFFSFFLLAFTGLVDMWFDLRKLT